MLALLFLGATALGPAAAATAAGPAPTWRACLSCHAEAGFSMATPSGENVALAVRAAELAGSAHRAVECRGCHPGVRLDAHPNGHLEADRDEFRRTASSICLTCHPAERLRATARHAALVSEDRPPACVGCHGSHGVQAVAALKSQGAPNDYCLICHSRPLALQRPDATVLQVAVDAAKLKASVHPKHRCADCHSGFSTTAHPSGAAADKNGRTLAAVRICARCHEDKLRQADGSVHFTLLRSGAQGAPGCSDCHLPHEVAPRERYATLAGTPCRGCHANIFAAYAGSMHGQALASGNHLDAPLCSDCHRAHDVQGSNRPELVRAACIGCHPTAIAIHGSWLPNAALHLDVVSCAACHAPTARRVVALRFAEQGTGRNLTEREVGDLFGGDVAQALDPTGEGIDGNGLWSALRRIESLRQHAAAKVDVVGRLEVARGADAHRLADKAGAVRACESCHEAGSATFERVAVSLARDDGRPKDFKAAPGMLTDAASLLSIHGFYALGATRHGVLDWLLVLAVAGGLSVVAIHLTFRIRAARARKEG
jgi:nitrate/TMAO reductase-like tetraheme cytochrome c subunit